MEIMKNRRIMRKILDEEVIYYSINIESDSDGTYLITSNDFPELTTFGYSIKDAVKQAYRALDEAIYARIENKDLIPIPSKGNLRIAVSLETLKAIWEYLT